MTIRRLFPTFVHVAPLQRSGVAAFNARLLRECLQLRFDDAAGRRWSQRNYPGGYTSYGSQSRMQRMSPTFAALERKLQRHLRTFVGALEFELDGRELVMTDCWVNIMPRQTAHGLHLHPTSTLSGTYYVKTPPGCAAIKFEDPRLDRFMAAPPRRAETRRENQTFVHYPAQAGNVILFESWLRHEVPANPVVAERVSVSFNYNWF